MRRPLVHVIAAAALAAPGAARADEPAEPSGVAAIAVGATATLLPLAIGGSRAATGPTFATKDQGLFAAASGVALAPVLAHVVVGETGRGLAFGAVPVASAIGIGVLLQANPGAVYDGTPASRTAFAILFNASLFGAALGVVDAAFAPARYRARRATPRAGELHVVPSFAPGLVAIGLGGSL